VISSDEIIGHANPHAMKKFELIEKYVEAWAHIILLNQYCTEPVFIDCMSNSGEYIDDDGKQVFGIPVRVAEYLRQIAGQYFGKQIDLYFSDLSAAKTMHLKNLKPGEIRNFHYYITAFPLFNEKNAIVYDLIHCINNLKGFQLYKKCAWQTFGGKSSTKNTHVCKPKHHKFCG
jgi:hypothetical protein